MKAEGAGIAYAPIVCDRRKGGYKMDKKRKFPAQLVVYSDMRGKFDPALAEFDLRSLEYIEKPKRALWTSTPTGESFASAWERWRMSEYGDERVDARLGYSYYDAYCEKEKEVAWEKLYLELSKDGEIRTLLLPKDNVRVIEIDSKEDYAKKLLFDENDHVDWKALSLICDGVHLTENGLAALGSCFGKLYGWDVESTVWLNADWIAEAIQLD